MRVTLVALAVAVAVLAEFFAIDVATSPGSPSFWKIYVVVLVVVGSALLAGWALLRPWVGTLPPPHQPYVVLGSHVLGMLLFLVGTVVLTQSILDALRKVASDESTCIDIQSQRLLRETREDGFAAGDAVDARWADLMQLQEESVRLQQERDLTAAQRKALLSAHKDRGRVAGDRWQNAIENNLRVTEQDPLSILVKRLKHPSQADLETAFVRALGC